MCVVSVKDRRCKISQGMQNIPADAQYPSGCAISRGMQNIKSLLSQIFSWRNLHRESALGQLKKKNYTAKFILT